MYSTIRNLVTLARLSAPRPKREFLLKKGTFSAASTVRLSNAVSRLQIGKLKQQQISWKRAILILRGLNRFSNRMQVEINHKTIRAPFAGVIAERLCEIGEWVAVGTTICHLVITI